MINANVVAMEPFKQFEMVIIEKIKILFDLSLTNGGLYLIISLVAFLWVIGISLKLNYVIAWFWKRVLEDVCIFVREMVAEQTGKLASKLVPTIFTVLLLILVLKVIPYSFAVTGQSVFTLTLSWMLFMALIIQGLIYLKLGFFNVFVPRGVSKGLLPLLVSIEILSFLIRPLSLSIRLFANILAGHILLLLISSTVISLVILSYIGGSALYVLLSSFIFLEIGIAFLQAYVFAILVCIYYKDAFIIHLLTIGNPTTAPIGRYMAYIGNIESLGCLGRKVFIKGKSSFLVLDASSLAGYDYFVECFCNERLLYYPASLGGTKGGIFTLYVYVKKGEHVVFREGGAIYSLPRKLGNAPIKVINTGANLPPVEKGSPVEKVEKVTPVANVEKVTPVAKEAPVQKKKK